nr:DNA replication licensing factor MCM6 [Seculamonas ecuadoriensis]
MEQQTISIAKAGIQATLNARTSVLAAANPIYGRYDKRKTLKANLSISAPIMSRFDLFFVIVDECDDTADANIARHITMLHQHRDAAIHAEISTEQLQTYIRCARSLKPKVTPAARTLLVEQYRKLRQNDVAGGGRSSYRITVRQLESMIRLSEALARLHGETEVRPEYVREAASLLQKSIVNIETDPVVLEEMEAVSRHVGADEAAAVAAEVAAEADGEPAARADAAAAAGDAAPAMQVDEAAAAAAAAAPRPRLQLTYEEYQKRTAAIVRRLRSQGNVGEPQGQLIAWYLESEVSAIDRESMEMEIKLMRALFSRLINRENVLVVLSEPEVLLGETDEFFRVDNRVVIVHPNYPELEDLV